VGLLRYFATTHPSFATEKRKMADDAAIAQAVQQKVGQVNQLLNQ
jgi:hypothetical protein